MAKLTLKNTSTHAVFKISNTTVSPGNSANIITLATDLLDSARETLGPTPTVNIINIQWTGVNGATFTIARSGSVIFYGDIIGSSPMNFNDFAYSDSENNTGDITVTITGQAQVYLGLRKVSGYLQKFKPEQLGSYA